MFQFIHETIKDTQFIHETIKDTQFIHETIKDTQCSNLYMKHIIETGIYR